MEDIFHYKEWLYEILNHSTVLLIKRYFGFPEIYHGYFLFYKLISLLWKPNRILGIYGRGHNVHFILLYPLSLKMLTVILFTWSFGYQKI